MSARFPAAKASGRPLVVGHRGRRGAAEPENTPAAFAAAAAAGADWVELDARRSADGVCVVIHDPVLPDGRAVVGCSVDELAAAGVSTLADVLAGLPEGLGVDLEVKNLPGEADYDPDNGVVAELAATAAATAQSRPLLVSSLNPTTVAAAAETLPGIACGFVAYDGLTVSAAVGIAVEFGAVALCPKVTCPGLDAEGVAAAHDAGLGVLVWTVNDLDEARRLAAAGVDAICGDDPTELARVLDAGAG